MECGYQLRKENRGWQGFGRMLNLRAQGHRIFGD
jgi:hypothetical protein